MPDKRNDTVSLTLFMLLIFARDAGFFIFFICLSRFLVMVPLLLC